MPKTMGMEDTKARPELVSEKKTYDARGMVHTRILVFAYTTNPVVNTLYAVSNPARTPRLSIPIHKLRLIPCIYIPPFVLW